MNIKIDQIPPEAKWAMSAQGLTGALAAHLDAIYRMVGNEKYTQAVDKIWAELGRTTAEAIKSSGVAVDSAASVAMAGVTSCICAMGPEYQIEQTAASENKTVMKISECPWNNRMKELGISHDLLSACDTAFWHHFTKNLNPDITMRHGKQMHRGAPYCEWIFETQK